MYAGFQGMDILNWVDMIAERPQYRTVIVRISNLAIIGKNIEWCLMFLYLWQRVHGPTAAAEDIY